MADVLVIDVEPAVRGMLRGMLESAGYSVREAAGGAEGIQEFGRHRADLVICELLMPQQEGLETIGGLRRLAPTLPVIAMTGGGRHLPPATLLEIACVMGAATGLAKPFTAEQLLQAVAGSLR